MNATGSSPAVAQISGAKIARRTAVVAATTTIRTTMARGSPSRPRRLAWTAAGTPAGSPLEGASAELGPTALDATPGS